MHRADAFVQDRLDVVDIWIAQRKLHWARIDLAQYLDEHPVLTVDPFTDKAEPMPGVEPEQVRTAMMLYKATREAHGAFLSLERWYLSHPSIEQRHSPFVHARRMDNAPGLSGPVMLPPPA